MDHYAQSVIPDPPPTPEPARSSGMSRSRRTTIIAIIIIVIVLVGIIAYAVAGLAYAQTRVGRADSTLGRVISHQHNLNSTFTDLNSKINSLSSSATFDPQQARTLYDQFVISETAAGVTNGQDDKSLASARASLGEKELLTLIARSSLDKEATKIDHARKALSIAKTAEAGYVQDGQYFQMFFQVQVDFELVSTQVASADFAGANATLTTMKTHVDKGLQLSTAPGLPSDLHSVMVDLGTLVIDFGKLLNAAASNNDAGVIAAENSVQADANKLGAYKLDTIIAKIAAYYKPMFDEIDAEKAKATA
jgi:hypothetical protein